MGYKIHDKMKRIDTYMNEALVGRRSPMITQADTDKMILEDVREAMIDWLDLIRGTMKSASWGTIEDEVLVFDLDKASTLDFIVIREHLPKEIMNCPRPIQLRSSRTFDEIIMTVGHMEGKESQKLSEIMSGMRFNSLICGSNLQYFRDFTLHIEARPNKSLIKPLQAATSSIYLKAASTPGALQGTLIIDKLTVNGISTGILLPNNDISIELSAKAKTVFKNAEKAMTIISDELVGEADSLWKDILKYNGDESTAVTNMDVPWALSKVAEDIVSKIHIPWENDSKALPTTILFISSDPIYHEYTLYMNSPGKYRLVKWQV